MEMNKAMETRVIKVLEEEDRIRNNKEAFDIKIWDTINGGWESSTQKIVKIANSIAKFDEKIDNFYESLIQKVNF